MFVCFLISLHVKSSVKGSRKICFFIHTSATLLFYCNLLLGSNGTAGAPDVVFMDPITGLLNPYPQCTMLLTGQCSGPVPSDCFLHPETGKILPVAGNVGYDPIISRLVCVVDSASGKCHKAIIIIQTACLWSFSGALVKIKQKPNRKPQRAILACTFPITKPKENLKKLLISMALEQKYCLASI